MNNAIEFYEFNRDLLPNVVQVFENHRLDAMYLAGLSEADEPTETIELNIEETGQYLKEACRILKLYPMAVAGLDAWIDDWGLDPGWCVNIYTVSSSAEGFIRDMFADSVLKDAVEITVMRHERDDEIGPSVSIQVGFTYGHGDLSLSSQYAALLRDLLENCAGI